MESELSEYAASVSTIRELWSSVTQEAFEKYGGGRRLRAGARRQQCVSR